MIKIPEGVSVNLSGSKVEVSGKLGKLSKTLSLRGLALKQVDGGIDVSGLTLMDCNTAESILRSMFEGVSTGYTRKLQIVYAHFPITIELKGNKMIIKNFLGEKQPRQCDIVGATKVELKAPALTVSGPSKEDVGQTVANIRTATFIKKKDSRVFQDGIYPVEE